MLKNVLRRRGGLDLTMNVLICLITVVFLFPLYWLFSSVFKPSASIVALPPQWWPHSPTLNNIVELFRVGGAKIWLFNSLFIAGATTLLVVIISALAAYAFAKLRFPGRNAIFLIFISTLMLPKEVFIVPLFKVCQNLGLYGSYTGAILPNVALPFGVFLLKNFFDTIPDALREAAKIDGASEYRTFFRIVMPLAKPGIGALAILMFVQTWNDYLWQLVMLPRDSMRTIQIAIGAMQATDQVDYGLRYAGAVLCALPMLVVFLIFQNYFARGVTLGAVKE